MNNYWITSQNRKKHQRAANKVVQSMNKNLCNDDLWKGRFYARMKRTDWQLYEDHSGGELYCLIELIDKKSGLRKAISTTANELKVFPWNFFREMNNFIVEDVDVWKENPKPDTTEDFRNV